MTTIQEYLNQKYPTQSDKEKVKKLILPNIDTEKKLEGGELDLSEYVSLEHLTLHGTESPLIKTLTKLKLGKMPNLVNFSCSYNELTSVDFLSELAHPEKLEDLSIVRNNFQPATLDFLRPFTGLKELIMGTIKEKIEVGIYNRFHGSLEPLKNMPNLRFLCISGTDVDSGLEYLSVPKSPISGRRWVFLDCHPQVPQAKCKAILDQLKPFNYNVWAWQLAHPEKTLAAQPKLFTPDRQEEKWEKAIKLEITRIEKVINEIRRNGKTPRARLESCLKLLREAQTKPWNFPVPNNNDKSENDPPNDNNKNNQNKNLTELKKSTKNQIQTELNKYNLKTSDLPSRFQNWETDLEKLEGKEEVENFQKEIWAAIQAKIKSKSQLGSSKNNSFSLPVKIIIGIGIVGTLVILVMVIWYLAKKKKKQTINLRQPLYCNHVTKNSL